MGQALNIFLLAGESSGDRIAAELVRRLRLHAPVELSGVGGDALEAEGLVSLFPMHELAVMGWADVLPRLPRLLWRARQVARTIIHTRPDVVVLVDAQVFSSVVAGLVHKAAADIPVLLCVAPAVWAWKPERAQGLKPRFREVLAVLPFEPAVMRDAGGPMTHYIGHPATEQFIQRPVPPQRGPLMLLPGSRDGELRRHLPLMKAIAARFSDHPRVTEFVLPTPRHLADKLRSELNSWPLPVTVISGQAEKNDAFASALAAVAVTGTVTLELALAGIPMVTTYVADRGQAKRWFQYKVKFAALPNAILDRPLVPEVLQLAPDVMALGDAVEALLNQAEHMERQLEGFAEIRAVMETGTPTDPRVDPASRVLASINRR